MEIKHPLRSSPNIREKQLFSSDRARVQAHQLNALVTADRADPKYGYRLLRDKAEQVGLSMNRRAAGRLASWEHIRSVIVKKWRGSGGALDPAVVNNLVRHNLKN